ncbi:imidazole glycerol phosphate synthase subunit HisH [Eubacteriales bacterium OttesenSCG-928-M02]|nr:imidazole glycerol phosphate synthase subunit HisH [Eubacteriales bacterium OttesenSCG-928-M02]
MLAIMDYGAGNLHSVEKAFRFLGADAIVTQKPKDIDNANSVVVPGVGAFGDAREKLATSGMENALFRAIKSGKPVLGICLGLQLLFETSYENGEYKGTGILPGEIKQFCGDGLKVPHMGWNGLSFQEKSCPLFEGLQDGCQVYFVHSYYAPYTGQDFVAATVDYGDVAIAAIHRDNLYATQFHPEKSGDVGMRMLQNFLAL